MDIQTARHAQDLADIEAGVQTCRRLIETEPNNADAAMKLAEGLLQLGQSREALHWFQHVLMVGPDSTSAQLGVGIALRKLNRPTEAIIMPWHV
jgi:predicted Zn-dependent protease